MKADIHPTYKPVVFQDISSDFSFLTQSTFFTGKQKVVDTAGRIDKFHRRYAK